MNYLNLGKKLFFPVPLLLRIVVGSIVLSITFLYNMQKLGYTTYFHITFVNVQKRSFLPHDYWHGCLEIKVENA